MPKRILQVLIGGEPVWSGALEMVPDRSKTGLLEVHDITDGRSVAFTMELGPLQKYRSRKSWDHTKERQKAIDRMAYQHVVAAMVQGMIAGGAGASSRHDRATLVRKAIEMADAVQAAVRSDGIIDDKAYE